LAKEQEQLLLSGKQRERLKILHEVQQRHLTQATGAEQLGVSDRWVRELVRRMRSMGDRAVVHGLRGKPSNRRVERKLEKKAVRLYQAEYSDFGPTLAAEYLAEKHGVCVSRETLRKWLISAGVWKAKRRRIKQVHTWRPRRSCRGELVQWDTSIHDWLEGRGEQKLKLIAMIDDASNELFARFVLEDSTVEHMRVLWRYLERNGRPLSFYTDKAALFHVASRRVGYYGDHSEGGETQIQRALRELGVELILAHSPQAKGRVERCFGVLQDRLVKGLRKGGASDLETANEHLERVFLPVWNRRFRRDPFSEVDAHRPLASAELASILSLVETRRVANDYTVSWHGQQYQIPRAAARPGLRSMTIRVEQRLDGTLWARVGEQMTQLSRCEGGNVGGATKASGAPTRKDHNRGGRSQWMNSFSLNDRSALVWHAMRDTNRSG
jgi:hypothetical protein